MNFKKINAFIADMHTHSEHSHDSTCPIANMAAMQKERGTSAFAVTDHCDIEYYERCNLEAFANEAFLDMENARRCIGGVEILRGIEIGESLWNKGLAEKIISANKYDVVIGSVHAVRIEGCSQPYSIIDFGKMGQAAAYEYFDKYLDEVLYMVLNTDFDILAHLTCPARYINGKYSLGISLSHYREKLVKILEAAIEKNIVLEVNTSCIGSGYNEFMPEEWIISLYREMGGTLISLGSDAHISENASHYFDKAIAMLKRNGFECLCYFRKRNLIKYKI